MNIGFVINGPKEHGIVRASGYLSAALKKMEDVSISILTTPEHVPTDSQFIEFKETLPANSVIILHGSHRTDSLWGATGARIPNLVRFLKIAQRPVVFYLHDIYGKGTFENLYDKIRRKIGRPKPITAEAGGNVQTSTAERKGFFEKILSYEERFVKAIDPYIAGYIVSNDIEARRLSRFVNRSKINIVPHFIERRNVVGDKLSVKRRLGLESKKVVTLLGFIVDRKGYDDAVEMMAHLPGNVHLVFAGKCNDEGYREKLQNRALALGVQDRLTITGYLDEETLDLYMAATDVAICPFKDVSASGSLATWLSANRPIVTYYLPLMREYKSKFPLHIHLSKKGSIKALARQVGFLLDDDHTVLDNSSVEKFSEEKSARLFLSILKKYSDYEQGNG